MELTPVREWKAKVDVEVQGPGREAERLRRTMDVVGASLLLVATSPLLLLGVATVWLVAGRPVFFGHRRVGRGGHPFLCWKLRTMERDAEERLERDAELRRRYVGNDFKLPHGEDPRVLSGTEWLRRLHIDELPQLVNVLAGDMSLVGPRPLVEEELAQYGEAQRVLLSRRPGLAGAWTARADRPAYPERARVELEYVERAGLRADVGILLRTALAVLRRWTGV